MLKCSIEQKGGRSWLVNPQAEKLPRSAPDQHSIFPAFMMILEILFLKQISSPDPKEASQLCIKINNLNCENKHLLRCVKTENSCMIFNLQYLNHFRHFQWPYQQHCAPETSCILHLKYYTKI